MVYRLSEDGGVPPMHVGVTKRSYFLYVLDVHVLI
jgi:hypothetical protein